MNWLWITVPLGAAFFIAMTAIPLWLTFRRLDTAPAVVPVPLRASRPDVVPPAATRTAAAAHASAEQAWLAKVSESRVRELAGAWQ